MNIPMEQKNMKTNSKKPLIIVFAGPNGSGKSTITEYVDKHDCVYVNADLIKSTMHCSDLEAAQIACEKREELLKSKSDFVFETVLSTRRNLDLLIRAKNEGYFIKCFYVLTTDPSINVSRVLNRVSEGGHDVPKDKIVKRYYRAMQLIPELINVCDVIHIYDNSIEPFRIFKKRKDEIYIWANADWDENRIKQLTEK